MKSRYAYVQYHRDIETVEVNKDGELIQLVSPSYKGQIDLTGISNYKNLTEDFPDSITGDIISQENLFNMIQLLFEKLEHEYEALSTKDSYTETRYHEFKDVYSYVKSSIKLRDKLKNMPKTAQALGIDMDTTGMVNDLANKFFILQQCVRSIQVEEKEHTTGNGKATK